MKTLPLPLPLALGLGLFLATGTLTGHAAERPAKPSETPTDADKSAPAARPEATQLVTGSRVPQKASRLKNSAAPTTAFPVVVITRQDLERTGRPTIAGALTRSPSFR